MAAADAGQHGGDMAIADLERLPELAVAPGDAGQAPLEGGDRKLGAAAFDLGSEVEADRFRIGRRFGKSLAAQPGSEHSPVRGVGALGVIGLGGAGVGLGGLRERRKAAAEAAGGREQGRGVRAGSLGLERRAFRLSAIPGAFVKTALRVGWRAGADRGGAAGGANPGAAGRGRLARRLGPAGLPGPWRHARPQACAARLNEAMWPSFAEVPAAAARANSGGAEEGAPASSDSDPARSDASASFPGSAEERRSGPDGPRAWGVADCRSSPNRALGAGPPLNRRAVVFRRLAELKDRLRSGLWVGQEGLRAWFCGVWHGVRAGLRNHVR